MNNIQIDVIDNFFDDDIFEYIYNTFPLPNSDIWKTPSNKHTKQKTINES